MLVHTTFLSHYPLERRGKVRDVYSADGNLLLVATDRVSAFDVVMMEPIPDKGQVLTDISLFWFNYLQHIVPNHYLSSDLSALPHLTPLEREQLNGRSMIVQKAHPFPVECVVRGYLAGSGWKEYVEFGTVCGIALPSGLRESARLPEPIFTPATKAADGHDQNISFAEMCTIVGETVAEHLRALSLRLYNEGSAYAASKGLILADTKFEFGKTESGNVILIDEVLTPDSSRYWLAADYVVGKAQNNFDKQILRDYLDSLDWNKEPPPPTIPDSIIAATRMRYLEARRMLTGQ